MDNYLKDVKNIIDQLETIYVIIPKDFLSMLFHHLPKEYQLFRKLLIRNDLLPPFVDLESKFLDKNMQIKMDLKNEMMSEMLFVKKGTLNNKNNSLHFSRGNTPMERNQI
jgi:hypothetical protein